MYDIAADFISIASAVGSKDAWSRLVRLWHITRSSVEWPNEIFKPKEGLSILIYSSGKVELGGTPAPRITLFP
jgi:hypothetical protein